MSLVEVESNPKSASMSFQKKLTFVFSLISFLGLLISTFIASYFSQNLVADSIIKSMHQRIVGLKSTIEVTYQDNLERQKQLIGNWGPQVIAEISSNESLFEKRMVTNQVTGEKQEVTLHKMNWHGQGIENHNLVDQLSKDTGAAVTVLQYSEVGLVRISTSIRKNDGLRATNTFIPKDSEVVKKLEKGEMFLGRAQVLGKWYMTAYQPILKEGRLLGAFFMGQYETSYEHIKTFLRSEKILKTGYLYVLDSRGVMQSHPTLEGKSAMDLTDADGFFLNKEVISKKSGQMKYRWEVDSQDKKGKEIVEKMAIFHYFPEMDWYVVASVPMEEVNEPVVSLRNTLYLVSSVMTLFMLITTLLFGRKVNQQMEVIGSEIEQASSVLTQRSSELAHSSDVLSDSAVKQASSLHETVSSLEQIKSMVEVNLDSTQKSEKLSANMKEEAGEGAKVLERLVSSIKNITRSNENMTSSLELNNKELLQIIDVIASINQKTMVINDIVFQTKLLSFNASVEAARAGEHGKGFSIVAEEVGRLAAMSGAAAAEIRKNLEESQAKVKELVEKSQDQVADLVADSKEKINEAASITEVCHKTFQGIITEVSEVFEAVHAIAKASKEQAHGIESITIAMEQIDTGIQQISTVAKQGQVLSANLNDNAGQLHESSNELQKFIKGKNFHKAS